MKFPLALVLLASALLAATGRAQTAWVRLKNDNPTGSADGYLAESPTQPGKVAVEKASWCDPYAQWALVNTNDGTGQILIQNRATGDRMNLYDNAGYVECDQSHSANDPSEKWVWTPTSPQAGDYDLIRNVGQASQYISVQAGAPSAGTSNGQAASARFRAEPVLGATVPYLEYEAENGTYTGTLLGPDTTFGHVESEASGREAVQLNHTGDYVQWTAKTSANAITVRYCIPDSAAADSNGLWGIQSTLDLYIDGRAQPQVLAVNSQHSWLYGSDDTPTETPGDLAHHFFDEVSVLLPTPIQAGQTVRLQKDSPNTAGYYVIDLIDLETVPAALTMPAGALSLADYGGQPSATFDNAPALNAVIAAAQAAGQAVWIPPGTWGQSTPVAVDGVAIYGAGIWYTQMVSLGASAAGTGAAFGVSAGTTISDLAIFGNVIDRGVGSPGIGADPGLGPGAGVVLNNLWIEHTGVGILLGLGKSPPTGLVVSNCRIRNTLADGVHIFNGPVNCTIENTTARSTGDDSLDYLTSGPGSNAITNCTVQTPWRADCYAFYGGSGNSITGCEGYDTAVHPGINTSLEFNATSFGPDTTNVQDVNLYRCGGGAYNGSGRYQAVEGSIWVNAETADIAGSAGSPALRYGNVNLYEPVSAGITVQCQDGFTQNDVVFDGIHIDHPTQYGIYIDPATVGSGTFESISIDDPGISPVNGTAPAAYTILGSIGTGAATLPAFFNGEVLLGNGVYYLAFPNGNPFGYYSFLTDPSYLFHYDLGYEYVFDAADGNSGVYFYDFASGDFFYTSPVFPFPYLFDFGLNAVLYYYPDPNDPGHYTSGPRYFYDFNSGQIISK